MPSAVLPRMNPPRASSCRPRSAWSVPCNAVHGGKPESAQLGSGRHSRRVPASGRAWRTALLPDFLQRGRGWPSGLRPPLPIGTLPAVVPKSPRFNASAPMHPPAPLSHVHAQSSPCPACPTFRPGVPGSPGAPLSPCDPGIPGLPRMPWMPCAPVGPGAPGSPCCKETMQMQSQCAWQAAPASWLSGSLHSLCIGWVTVGLLPVLTWRYSPRRVPGTGLVGIYLSEHRWQGRPAPSQLLQSGLPIGRDLLNSWLCPLSWAFCGSSTPRC